MPQVLHNALRRITALQRAYRIALGANDDPAFRGIERAGESLTPIMDLWSRPEWMALRGEVWFSYRTTVNPVAAEQAFIGLRNPAGSNLIVVVAPLALWSSTAGVIRTFHGVTSATDIDGLEQVVPRDTRYNLAGVTAIFGFHGTGVAAVGNDALEELAISTSGTLGFNQNLPAQILTPGFDVRYYRPTVNTSLNGSLIGRARIATPEELAQIQG